MAKRSHSKSCCAWPHSTHKALQRITQMSHAHDSASAAARRRAARLAWRDFEVAAGDEDNLAVLQRACDGSFHIDFPNSEGQTLLMACSFSASPKSAAHLLALGADPNIQNASGRTAALACVCVSWGSRSRDALHGVAAFAVHRSMRLQLRRQDGVHGG